MTGLRNGKLKGIEREKHEREKEAYSVEMNGVIASK